MERVAALPPFMLRIFPTPGPARLVGLALGLACVAHAEGDPAPDKSGYTLFNPVPAKWLRDLNPDRPDKTDGPGTVDAGHFEWEMDFANFTQTTRDGDTERAWNAAPFEFRVGLTNSVEADVLYDDAVIATSSLPGSRRLIGFGDLTLRSKIAFCGNDGGPVGIGAIPFVKLPTAARSLGNGSVEGGLAVPVGTTLPGDWDFGVMTELDIDRNDGRSGYHAAYVNSATLGHAIAGKWSGYAEFYSEVSAERGQGWVGTVDFGLLYKLNDNVQLDCGANLGVTRAADDLNLFSGITVRF